MNKAANVLVTCPSNRQDQDLESIRKCFYETIYGTTKFEFWKFTSTKESSAFLEVIKNTYYHSFNFTCDNYQKKYYLSGPRQ